MPGPSDSIAVQGAIQSVRDALLAERLSPPDPRTVESYRDASRMDPDDLVGALRAWAEEEDMSDGCRTGAASHSFHPKTF